MAADWRDARGAITAKDGRTAEEIIAEEGFKRVGRMCPVCLMWSEDDREDCPGECDDIEGMEPAKRFRIYRMED